MPKIMEIIEKETKGKSYHTYKYSYDSIGIPSIDYDDESDKVMKWQDTAETVKETVRDSNMEELAGKNFVRDSNMINCARNPSA